MKLSAPWIKFYRELEALFAEDEEVRVVYDEEVNEVKLYVENSVKAEALSQLLPEEKTFGNVTLRITVIPGNNVLKGVDLFSRAFEGNPALSYVLPIDCPMGHFEYAIFKPKVVQFFNDDIGDLNGLCSTLYQDIAKDVFGSETGIFFCTEPTEQKLQKPLGEWP